MQYYINSRSWELILAFLETEKGIHTEDKNSLKMFVEGIWYITKSGIQWRLLPSFYGCWRAAHRRFQRWCEKKIWNRLMAFVSDVDLQEIMIDATIVRAHACAAGYKKNSTKKEALGRSKGGFTTKIHTVVDALGNPIKFILTPGQTNDITQAQELTKDFKNTIVIADKGYDSEQFIDYLLSKGCTPVIPPRKNRKKLRTYDKNLYKERHLVEGLVGKIKHFRRVFSRFEKTANCYLGFLHFVGALLWLR